MCKLLLLPLVSGLTLLMGACADPNYKPDPSVELCNVGGPLGFLERSLAMEVNPGAVPGRPPECRVGPDGVMRMPQSAAR
jgi:hypothetical protein